MEEEEKRELVALGKFEEAKPVVFRNKVFDKLLTTDHITSFPSQKYYFLQLVRRGSSVEDAAVKAGIELEQAREFAGSPKAQEYLRDREIAGMIAEEAKDETRWWVRAEGVMQGDIKLSKGQTETFKEMGRRVAPIIGEQHGSTKIEINIDGEALERYRAKKKAVDAELINEV